MKKIACLFVAMIAVFTAAWAYKLRQPLNAGDAYANGADPMAGAWWNIGSTNADIIADAQWRLDPEIPDNYIPVLGAEELYMVVDEDGNIIKYRKRTLQEDGTWIWEDVNPDIPEHYEKVEGLDNVYKITEADGTVRYVKYVRNDDDTFYFIDVDENGNPLQSIIPQENGIPDNFVRVTGNIYAVYNEHGVIIGYVERIQNPDGTYSWVEVDKPDIPVTQPVNISEDIQPTDQPQEGQTPQVPAEQSNTNNATGGPIYIIVDENKSATKTEPKSDGGYIETETYTETKVEDDTTIIYETTITRTYDSSGNLMSTKKDGPKEIGRHGNSAESGGTATPNPNRIEDDIYAEYVRVTNGLRFNTALADEVLAQLNAERVAKNLSPLAMADGDIYYAACIKAADMAIHNHSDFDSPMYGTIDTMLVMFGVTVESPAETLWKTSPKSAEQIHSRFQAQAGSYASRMSSYHSEVAIAIVEKNGTLYIAEIFN